MVQWMAKNLLWYHTSRTCWKSSLWGEEKNSARGRSHQRHSTTKLLENGWEGKLLLAVVGHHILQELGNGETACATCVGESLVSCRSQSGKHTWTRKQNTPTCSISLRSLLTKTVYQGAKEYYLKSLDSFSQSSLKWHIWSWEVINCYSVPEYLTQGLTMQRVSSSVFMFYNVF